MKRFARYIVIGSGYDLLSLINVARKQGMLCISASKPSFCAFNEIGLAGTAEQMRRTDEVCRATGVKPLTRKPSAAFGVNLERAVGHWVDPPVGVARKAVTA